MSIPLTLLLRRILPSSIYFLVANNWTDKRSLKLRWRKNKAACWNGFFSYRYLRIHKQQDCFHLFFQEHAVVPRRLSTGPETCRSLTPAAWWWFLLCLCVRVCVRACVCNSGPPQCQRLINSKLSSHSVCLPFCHESHLTTYLYTADLFLSHHCFKPNFLVVTSPLL